MTKKERSETWPPSTNEWFGQEKSRVRCPGEEDGAISHAQSSAMKINCETFEALIENIDWSDPDPDYIAESFTVSGAELRVDSVLHAGARATGCQTALVIHAGDLGEGTIGICLGCAQVIEWTGVVRNGEVVHVFPSSWDLSSRFNWYAKVEVSERQRAEAEEEERQRDGEREKAEHASDVLRWEREAAAYDPNATPCGEQECDCDDPELDPVEDPESGVLLCPACEGIQW